MSNIVAYHRPTSLDEAADLLTGSNRSILAGGTAIVPAARADRTEATELIDLQSLELDQIQNRDERVVIGAMVRLADLSTDDRVGSLLRDLARRELPSVMRDQATVGGTIASAEAQSVLIAGLLVHDGQVEFHRRESMPLTQALAEGTDGALITAVSIDPSGTGAIAATGRTPADEPIVAAVARSTPDGMRLALTGVASTVVEVNPGDPVAGLEPPSDFRGSSDYRKTLATVLSGRVSSEVA